MDEGIHVARFLAFQILGDIEALHLAAIWQLSRDGSKRLILETPDTPARMPDQASATVLPTGETMPIR